MAWSAGQPVRGNLWQDLAFSGGLCILRIANWLFQWLLPPTTD
jgi:hypothetical protein